MFHETDVNNVLRHVEICSERKGPCHETYSKGESSSLVRKETKRFICRTLNMSTKAKSEMLSNEKKFKMEGT